MKSIVNKPWGSFEIINEGNRYAVKKIIVNPGGQLSLQSHKNRSEHWLIAEGNAEVIINEETFNLNENQHIFIPQGAKHRLINKGDKNLIVVEMWFGDNLDENDIKRYEDIYNRDS
jgi:mannose-6-phosphate isomerase-like protein (cupin superfamily)